MNFEERIKALKAEVEALKTAKHKSSSVLNTVTKTATCTATLYKTSHNVVTCRWAGLVKITPKNSNNEPLISYAQPSYADRGNRDVSLVSWVDGNGTLGILCVPSDASSDSSMTAGSTKDITITIYITATDDFTTTSSQVRAGSE